MPVSFRIDRHRGLVVVRAWDTLGTDGLYDAVLAQSTHADYRPTMDIVWDLREARILVEYEEMLAFTERISSLRTRRESHKVAFVVQHEPTRMLVDLFPRVGPEHPVDYRSFGDVGEALGWLGLPADYPL